MLRVALFVFMLVVYLLLLDWFVWLNLVVCFGVLIAYC